MKKTTILATTLVALSIMILSWNKAQKSYEALHIDPLSCNVINGDGNFEWVGEGKGVITMSGNGNYSCKGTVANSTGKAVTWNYENTGLVYFTPTGSTDNWQAVTSVTGEHTTTVHDVHD